MRSTDIPGAGTAENNAADVPDFELLYSGVQNELYRYCLYFLGNSEDAKDAVQDTAAAAYKGYSSLRSIDSFKPWIFKIAYRCCKRHIHNAAAGRSCVSYDSLDIDIADDGAGNPDDALHIADSLQQLSIKDRRLILLSLVCGYKSSEIAKATGKTDSAVRTSLSRAVAKLRTILEKE